MKLCCFSYCVRLNAKLSLLKEGGVVSVQVLSCYEFSRLTFYLLGHATVPDCSMVSIAEIFSI